MNLTENLRRWPWKLLWTDVNSCSLRNWVRNGFHLSRTTISIMARGKMMCQISQAFFMRKSGQNLVDFKSTGPSVSNDGRLRLDDCMQANTTVPKTMNRPRRYIEGSSCHTLKSIPKIRNELKTGRRLQSKSCGLSPAVSARRQLLNASSISA